MNLKPDRELSELSQKLEQGEISRREFLRSLALLGLSLGAAETLAACGLQPSPTPYPTAYNPVVDDPTLLAAAANLSKTPAGPPGPQAAAQGEPAPAPTGAPRKPITWRCDSCGEHLPTRGALADHAAARHWRRMPEIRRVEQPTYSRYIVGPVPRFDERNTALSRSRWDAEYQARIGEAAARAKPPGEKTQEGLARVAGGIYVDDTAGALHPAYGGYSGHLRGVGGLYNWGDPVSPVRLPVSDPAGMSAQIKAVARLYGADLVGICQVDPRWVYSHFFESDTGDYGKFELSQPYAIVMGVEMDWDGINESPGFGASAATSLAYSRMAELSASLAKYIRGLGYPALPSGNDSAQSIPLAIDAGLGELGRNGLLLTPEFGPRQRICKVFTDLPLQIDRPIDFGAGAFCEACHACASSCPVDAIPSGDRSAEPTSISNRTGISRWHVDTARCFLFWIENGTDCSNCVAACPWALPNPRDWLEI